MSISTFLGKWMKVSDVTEKALIHPWQSGPTELISLAIHHLRNNNDFDRRIAFLLLDIGIETLLKTYLTLPDKITGAKTKFHERKDASESNFHSLLKGVETASPQLEGYDFSYLQFYHDLRNKLYHQGNGITVSEQHVNGYAELAVELLKTLLN
jgi:hypothetical protein